MPITSDTRDCAAIRKETHGRASFAAFHLEKRLCLMRRHEEEAIAGSERHGVALQRRRTRHACCHSIARSTTLCPQQLRGERIVFGWRTRLHEARRDTTKTHLLHKLCLAIAAANVRRVEAQAREQEASSYKRDAALLSRHPRLRDRKNRRKAAANPVVKPLLPEAHRSCLTEHVFAP